MSTSGAGAVGGWGRRNRLALAALPFVVSAVLAVGGEDLLDVWFADDTVRQVGGYEPFAWSGASFQLTELTVVAAPTDADGQPYQAPAGTAVWRSTWRGSTTDDSVGYACELSLIDTSGRRFDADPAEAIALGGDGSCAPSGDADLADYRFVRYFLMPTDTEPARLRFGSAYTEVVELTLD